MSSRWTIEKKMVASSFIFVFMTILVTGILMERSVSFTKYGGDTRSFDGLQPVRYSPLQQSASTSKLKAVVEGSIYETGSNMTVYGACYDGDGLLLPAADAKFSAWYPNGSLMVGPNATMDRIYDDFQGYNPSGTGRWKIHVTMVDTVGTYLTELRCEYGGQWAMAVGEWQNPEWVARIGASQSTVGNISADLSSFRSEVSGNFSSVLNLLSNFSMSVVNATASESVDQIRKLKEIYNSITALPMQFWMLDDSNPSYSLGSGVNNFRAVDMAGKNVCAASLDGVAQCWDGSVWTYYTQPLLPGIQWNGVAMTRAAVPYAWYVGLYSGTPYFSINGALAQMITGTSNSNVFDVKLIRSPNDPSGNVTAVVLGNAEIITSSDYGVSWNNVFTSSDGSATGGRLSNIIWNSYPDVTTGYRYAAVTQRGELIYYDGVSISSAVFTSEGYEFADVVLISPEIGYIVGKDTGSGKNKVWLFSGSNLSNLTVEYEWNLLGSANPKAIAAPSTDDVWVVTNDPSVFYHYDGFKWSYENFPYSRFLTITIGFGNVTVSTGMHDIVMSDEFNGYAVGDDGLVLKLENKQDEQFKSILQNLSSQISAIQVNLTPALDALQELNLTLEQHSLLLQQINSSLQTVNVNLTPIQESLVAMNASIAADFSVLGDKVDQMNASIQYKLDNLLFNATYSQLYMQTTLEPMINSTYQNTISILVQLGLMQAQLNQTLQLQNETLRIVNSTDHKVDTLVDNANRMHAWTTQ